MMTMVVDDDDNVKLNYLLLIPNLLKSVGSTPQLGSLAWCLAYFTNHNDQLETSASL